MKIFEKKKIALRYWLLGRGFHTALKAFDIAESYHTGFRKDGVTPEFAHQIEIALFVRTIRISEDIEERVFTLIFLHDVREDYGVTHNEIVNVFGNEMADLVELITKKFNNETKLRHDYFTGCSSNIIVAITKGVDRIHNISTMEGVFTPAKQLEYCAEVETDFFPMLKRARRSFPTEDCAIQGIKYSLQLQIGLIKKILEYEFK